MATTSLTVAWQHCNLRITAPYILFMIKLSISNDISIDTSSCFLATALSIGMAFLKHLKADNFCKMSAFNMDSILENYY